MVSAFNRLLQDILKVKDPEKSGEDKFSQSRVYLLITFLTILGACIYGLLSGYFEYSLDTLFALLLIFAGYALASKGLKYSELINKR